MKNTKIALFFGIILGVVPALARADVLSEITDTTEKLCVDVAQKGQSSSADIKGDVNAELSGLARRLANLAGC